MSLHKKEATSDCPHELRGGSIPSFEEVTSKVGSIGSTMACGPRDLGSNHARGKSCVFPSPGY